MEGWRKDWDVHYVLFGEVWNEDDQEEVNYFFCISKRVATGNNSSP